MKIQSVLAVAFLVLLSACVTTKDMNSDNSLYGTTWQLEYMSGPRIAFEGLFPDKKPEITFNKKTKQVTGNNSCNGYSASYSFNGNAMDGTSISFGDPGPTTMMYCGEGEQQFLNMMKRINTYGYDSDGKLLLKLNEVPLMRFKKVN
jgi:heat shock protein HslJ